jgi:hypothetical protein
MARCLGHVLLFPDEEDWVFVKKALSSAEARRLRISRFERDGRSLEHLAETISRKFVI